MLTMYDARNSLARQVVEQIRGHFGESVYQTMIPRNVTLAEAPQLWASRVALQHGILRCPGLSSPSQEFVTHGEKSPR